VQAVNGVGLVTLATNVGAYFTPDVDPAAPPTSTQQPTAIALEQPTASGIYGTPAQFGAVLSGCGGADAGQATVFGLGAQSIQAPTDNHGRATATLTLLGLSGQTELGAAFAGTPELGPSFASGPFTIAKQDTSLTLTPLDALVLVGADATM